MVKAHRRDGAALCIAFSQLESMVGSGEALPLVIELLDLSEVVPVKNRMLTLREFGHG